VKSKAELEILFDRWGAADHKWINPADIVVAQWVRMKCMFGCDDYGRVGSCPPNVPSVAECRTFFSNYSECAIFHFAHKVDKPEDRRGWSKDINANLLKLERDVFLAGYPKAFLLFMDRCRLCVTCPGSRSACKDPLSSRPSPEGMAIDVFATVRQVGYPIEVLSDYSQEMNRYAFLLIE
jgi:predicted metal-binding protein